MRLDRQEGFSTMGFGTGVFLVAVGAVLRLAVTAQSNGFSVHTAGVILMVIGALVILLSLIFWTSWGGVNRTDVIVEDGAAPRHHVVESG
jgi:hypothetical protein